MQQVADALVVGLLPLGHPQRSVIVMIDEMHVHEGTVEDPKTGEWVGSLDDEDQHDLGLESGGQALLANKALVAMVSACLRQRLVFTLCIRHILGVPYTCDRQNTASRMYNAVLEMCEALSHLGLDAAVVIMDGASDNLELLRMLLCLPGASKSTTYNFKDVLAFTNPFAIKVQKVHIDRLRPPCEELAQCAVLQCYECRCKLWV
jgi:hypothetical protein